MHTLLEKWLRNKEGLGFCCVLDNRQALVLPNQKRQVLMLIKWKKGCWKAALFFFVRINLPVLALFLWDFMGCYAQGSYMRGENILKKAQRALRSRGIDSNHWLVAKRLFSMSFSKICLH